MKILILTAAFDGLCQQAYAELVELGHTVGVQSACSDAAMEAAVMHFKPQLVIAPFLKKTIPASIQQQYTVLCVRPGTTADRGPTNSRGSISEGWQDWRISITQSSAEKGCGEIWTSHTLKMRSESKPNFFRHHIAQAAVKDILDAVDKLERNAFSFKPLHITYQQLNGRLHKSAL